MRKSMALGAFFVVAICVAACGSSSSLGSKNVAVVAGNPISKQAFNHWMYVAEKGQAAEAAEEGESSPVIVPTDPPNFTGCIKQVRAQVIALATTAAATIRSDCNELFQSLGAQVMDFLVKGYWYQATGYQKGIKITAAELAKSQKQQLPTKADLQQLLTTGGETQADIDFRLRVNLIYQKLITAETPKLTAAAVAAYYKAHVSEFGTPEERDLLLVKTSSQATAKAALAALNSGQSWAAVAKKYSTDAATKDNGGVLTDVQNGEEEQALNKVAFAAPLNKTEGPIHGEFGWYLVKVTKIIKGTQTPLAKATAEIKELLESQNQTTAANKVNAAAKKQWGSKTQCASEYNVVSDCAGYKAPKTNTTTTTTPSSAASSGTVATVTSSGTSATASSTTKSSTATKTSATQSSTTKSSTGTSTNATATATTG